MKYIKKFENYRTKLRGLGNSDNIENSDDWIESVSFTYRDNPEKAKIIVDNIKRNNKFKDLLHYVKYVLRDSELEKWILSLN